MACPDPAQRVYRPRRPRASPLHQLLDQHFDTFERVDAERYQSRYGVLRSAIRPAVTGFLKCGDLHHGFARVRCPDCQHEMFVAFSCRKRCLCPSCHQKRTLLMAMHVAEDVCAPVAHRQLVFTIPKRFRVFFRYDRSLLGDLARVAWETIREVHRAVLGREDVVPGAVAGIQTFGQLVHWHPHIHALVTEGAFTPDLSACSHAQAGGRFLPLPDIDSEPFLRLWEHKVFRLLLARISHHLAASLHAGSSAGGVGLHRRCTKTSPASPSLPADEPAEAITIDAPNCESIVTLQQAPVLRTKDSRDDVARNPG